MKSGQKYLECFAALSGFSGVLLGALAAHKAQDAYAENLLRLASYYQLIHSVMIFILADRQQRSARIACAFFILGIVLFCGALCSKALIGPTFFIHLAPAGGTCLMIGWLATAELALRRQ